jgi:hypothetical protein
VPERVLGAQVVRLAMERGNAMSAHKFTIGQTVRFSPHRQQESASRGRFKVVRLMPETESVLQYRVKSQVDGHERVVREDQLDRS